MKKFQYHQVDQVQQQLKSNNFFKARHTINLFDKNENIMEEITTDDSLKERIEIEKIRIIGDPELKNRFDNFNNKLKKNKELQNFRDYIADKQYILPELQDLEGFERKRLVTIYFKSKRGIQLSN